MGVRVARSLGGVGCLEGVGGVLGRGVFESLGSFDSRGFGMLRCSILGVKGFGS